MTFPILGGNSAVATYSIDNSLRFNDNDSAYLSRTPSSATNRKTWTWSGWVKRGNINTEQYIFAAGENPWNNPSAQIYFTSGNELQVFEYTASTQYQIKTNRLFRDVSAWYHIVVVFNTTEATSSDRIKIYLNGVEETSFSVSTYPSLNYDGVINNTKQHNIGSAISVSFFDGYMAEANFIDGTAKSPTDFGEFDEDSGIWKPIEYTGTYGTNGFYLDFENSGSLGADQSGNGNNFTPTNLASTDQTTDSPTNNWCTLNPLGRQDLDLPYSSFSEGNTVVDYTSAGLISGTVPGTFGSKTGKWYAEFKLSAYYGGSLNCGFTFLNGGTSGTAFKNVSATGTYMVAFDIDNSLYWTGTNGVWDAGDPSAGTGGTSATIISDRTYTIFVRDNSGSNGNGGKWELNAGNPPFSISSGNSDDNGYGNFEYAPPTGFLALCTQNLATELSPTIDDGSEYFSATKYQGGGFSPQSITGVGFQPDWVWLKNRTISASPALYDSSRGVQKALFSDSTSAETTRSGLTSFDSDGFSLGSAGTENGSSSNEYISWNWKANAGSTSSNTDGSITSTVQANTTAGFSVVTYTGNQTNGATVGHGLGIAPQVVIIKERNGTSSWIVKHPGLTDAGYYLILETTNAQSTAANVWNDTDPSSTVFTLGDNTSVNENTLNYVAYCFAEIEGYSKFGSYTGNANADGPFVYTGFRPAWIMAKNSTSAGVGYHWYIWDSKRDTFNVADNTLHADESNAENTFDQDIDFLSNGFKLRGSGVGVNGGTMIYMAFAENPFVSSTGIPVTAR